MRQLHAPPGAENLCTVGPTLSLLAGTPHRAGGQGARHGRHAAGTDGAGGDTEPDGGGAGGEAAAHPGALQR